MRSFLRQDDKFAGKVFVQCSSQCLLEMFAVDVLGRIRTVKVSDNQKKIHLR